MKLRDLEARFIKRTVTEVDPTKFVDGMLSPSGRRVQYATVQTLLEADGVMFKCPLCVNTKHPHQVTCWFTGKVPDDADPKSGRWNPQGTGLDDLTFVPGKKTQSVQLLGGCNWHGFVTNGEAK